MLRNSARNVSNSIVSSTSSSAMNNAATVIEQLIEQAASYRDHRVQPDEAKQYTVCIVI